ncbi:MAG: cell division protein FtsZ [Candidatus Pacebacteria bacterium]|nr:cell division protein FtsZ [Candidatus Paceibacterota bacterium]
MPINNIPKIKVVGIGGSGVNAVSRMNREKVSGVELIAVNTDAQVLKVCPVQKKILIGKKTTGGFGAGMDIHLGEKAAKESYAELKQALEGAELVFLTCGLGGGSGSAGISVLGEIAKSVGALTVAIVTLPFGFEGAQRKNIANWGLKRLESKVDSFLVIQNDRLLKLVGPNTTIDNAFWVCDSILREAVKGISDLVSLPGIINVDFADLRNILLNSGRAFLGIGRAKGEKRALSAASSALQSPLLDFSLRDAQGILLNIAGNDDLSITEVNIAATFIKKNALASAKIIFGVSEDTHLEKGELKITLIATSKV